LYNIAKDLYDLMCHISTKKMYRAQFINYG